MSSEGENNKNSSSEVDDKGVQDVTDSPQESKDKVEKVNDKSKENADGDQKLKENPPELVENDKKTDEVKKDKVENDTVKDKDDTDKKEKKEKVENKTDDIEEGEESGNDEEDSENEDKKDVPLLDQPLEQSGPRDRKKVQRFNDESGKLDIPDGIGTELGEIPRIDASISRFKNDDLKLLHKLLFKTLGKTTMIKKNIKKFNGFDFKKDSEEYKNKISSAQKFEIKQLKSICEMLDLEKKGSKDEIVQRVVEFLLEPKDSGKAVGGGRPKRTAAVRANNRGYSSHDDSYSSDERQAARRRRGKGKRTNLKDDSTSGSDEEFHPSDGSEERPRVTKRKRSARQKALSDEDDISDVDDSASSEESDEMFQDDSKKRKKGKKVANNKPKPKVTPRGRGRKSTATPEKAKATPKRPGRKAKDGSDEESEPQDEDASSSEDEPLIKKTKSPQPPTDEEIKKYVKEILDGANLEEITMKTVCKQVYAHYPDFDLAHKKDFIKTTVKSLIST